MTRWPWYSIFCNLFCNYTQNEVEAEITANGRNIPDFLHISGDQLIDFLSLPGAWIVPRVLNVCLSLSS